MKINFKKFKELFPKDWISSILPMYMEGVRDCNNSNFLRVAGDWPHPMMRSDPEMVQWTDNMLYPPNIAILDYVIKNMDFFSDKRIIDNGTGVGILLIFLDKLGIDCMGYDDGSQMGSKEVSKFDGLINNYNQKFGKNIQITTDIPTVNDNDVVTSAGIWCDKVENAKMYMLDALFVDKAPEWLASYRLKCTYPNLIQVYVTTK